MLDKVNREGKESQQEPQRRDDVAKQLAEDSDRAKKHVSKETSQDAQSMQLKETSTMRQNRGESGISDLLAGSALKAIEKRLDEGQRFEESFRLSQQKEHRRWSIKAKVPEEWRRHPNNQASRADSPTVRPESETPVLQNIDPLTDSLNQRTERPEIKENNLGGQEAEKAASSDKLSNTDLDAQLSAPSKDFKDLIGQETDIKSTLKQLDLDKRDIDTQFNIDQIILRDKQKQFDVLRNRYNQIVENDRLLKRTVELDNSLINDDDIHYTQLYTIQVRLDGNREHIQKGKEGLEEITRQLKQMEPELTAIQEPEAIFNRVSLLHARQAAEQGKAFEEKTTEIQSRKQDLENQLNIIQAEKNLK